MNESVEKSPATKRKLTLDEDGPEDESAADERWHGRLKRLLRARLVGALAAGIGFLEQLKARAGDNEEPEERRHAKPAPAPQATAEAPPLPRRRLRSFLVTLGVVLLAGILGMGFAYSLLSKMLKDQSAKLETQQQEISVFQLQEQEQAIKLADLMKKLDAERTKRLEAEKQLGEIDVKRPEAEAKEIAAQPQQESGGSRSLRPSRGSTFSAPAAPKVTDCNLAGGDAGALKRCLDDFNRK